jgi:transcription termination factor NusB
VSERDRPAAGPPPGGATRPRGGQRSGDSRRRGGSISARRKSRELALQGLYEWLIGGADAGVVDAHVREREGFEQGETQHHLPVQLGLQLADRAGQSMRIDAPREDRAAVAGRARCC